MEVQAWIGVSVSSSAYQIELLSLLPTRDQCDDATVYAAFKVFLLGEWLIDVATNTIGKCLLARQPDAKQSVGGTEASQLMQRTGKDSGALSAG